jgi:hypothetical protein
LQRTGTLKWTGAVDWACALERTAALQRTGSLNSIVVLQRSIALRVAAGDCPGVGGIGPLKRAVVPRVRPLQRTIFLRIGSLERTHCALRLLLSLLAVLLLPHPLRERSPSAEQYKRDHYTLRF